jgi:hypothetical protein
LIGLPRWWKILENSGFIKILGNPPEITILSRKIGNLFFSAYWY